MVFLLFYKTHNHIWLLHLKILASGEFHFWIRRSKHTLPSVSWWMQLKSWIEPLDQQFKDSEKSIVAGGLKKPRIWSTAMNMPWPGQSAAHTWKWASGVERESSRRSPPILTWWGRRPLTLRERGVDTSSFKKASLPPPRPWPPGNPVVSVLAVTAAGPTAAWKS